MERGFKLAFGETLPSDQYRAVLDDRRVSRLESVARVGPKGFHVLHSDGKGVRKLWAIAGVLTVVLSTCLFIVVLILRLPETPAQDISGSAVREELAGAGSAEKQQTEGAMWPFGKAKGRGVKVQFVDVQGKVVFPPVELPFEKLPESFEAETTMHLGDADWLIVEAQPMTAKEFTASGQLELRIQRVERGVFTPTDENFFSLPTISDELPSIEEGTTKLGKKTLELHEDDWRQVEWVAGSMRQAAELDLAAIREIHASQRVTNGGFKNIHVRKNVPSPLRGTTVTLKELVTGPLKGASMLDGVAFQRVAGLVERSFVIRLTSGGMVYGLQKDGQVEVVGFRRALSEEEIHALAEFGKGHGMVLIDWCRAEAVEDEQGYKRTLGSK